MEFNRSSTTIDTSSRRVPQIPRLGALLLVATAWIGCTTVDTALPPIAEPPTGEHRVGKFVWIDLLTEDPAAARVFYQRLFQWTFDDSTGPAGYFTIRNGDRAIGGLARIENTIAAPEAIWLASLSVDDVDAAAEVATSRGGEVVEAPIDVDGRGRMAVLRDPSGAELAVLRSASGDPVGHEPAAGSWLWIDLVTNDAAAAEAFYAELVGYEVQTVELGDDLVYKVIGRDGHARAGIVEVQWEKVESNWLPYVGVTDLNATIHTAYSLGGRLLLRNGDVAILTDPTGGAFGIQQLAEGTK